MLGHVHTRQTMKMQSQLSSVLSIPFILLGFCIDGYLVVSVTGQLSNTTGNSGENHEYQFGLISWSRIVAIDSKIDVSESLSGTVKNGNLEVVVKVANGRFRNYHSQERSYVELLDYQEPSDACKERLEKKMPEGSPRTANVYNWPRKAANGLDNSQVSNMEHSFATSEQFVRNSESRKFLDAVTRLDKRLSPSNKWHYMVGYCHVDALRVAKRFIRSAPIQHVSTKENVKYFLTFIPKRVAERMRNNVNFHAVEPIVGKVKIEGLSLGKRIREIESRQQSAPLAGSLSLKANLAKHEFSLTEAKAIATRWEKVLRSEHWRDSHGSGNVINAEEKGIEECQRRGFNSSEDNIVYVSQTRNGTKKAIHDQQFPPTQKNTGMKCEAQDESSVICHLVHDRVLKHVAEFMAEQAPVQLVEIQPSYDVFNYWSRPLLQSVSADNTPIYKAGLRGEGEIIAHADTGIDMSHCFFYDGERPVPFNSVDYDARKVIEYRALDGGDFSDAPMGHGTHVAGSIAGDTKIGGDAFSGMAPAAKIGESND